MNIFIYTFIIYTHFSDYLGMVTLYDYILEQSDDSVIYRIAKHVWNSRVHKSKESCKRDMDKYNISKEHPRAGIIRWYKDNFPPISDGKGEVIPRSQWDLENLVGQTETQIMHRDYDKVLKYHLAHPLKRHDVCMVFECTNKKPYNNTHSNIQYLRLYDKYCDFGNAAYGIVPYGYCQLYPYRYDEWDHYSEGEYGAWVYREVSKINFKLFNDAWGYKRYVVVMQNEHPMEFITQIKKDNLWGLGDKIDIVIDHDFHKKMKSKYSSVFGDGGLIITRMMGLPETKIATCKALRAALKDTGASKEWLDETGEILSILNSTKGEKSTSKELKKAGFGVNPSWAEYPYGKKETKDEDDKKKVNEGFITEGLTQKDFGPKLTRLQKELDELDIEKIGEQKIEKDMGDDVNLMKNPDSLYSKYEWAWPCLKLLYWMKGKKFDENLQSEYDSLNAWMKKQKDWGCINGYFFYYKPITDKLGWGEKDVWKKALTIHFIEDARANQKEELLWP